MKWMSLISWTRFQYWQCGTHYWHCKTFLTFFQSGPLHCLFIQTNTHPHAGLQADLWHDWEERDTSIHPSTLRTDNLVWVRRLWEVCGATLVCCQGNWCYVRALREMWNRWIRWAVLMDWKPLGYILCIQRVRHKIHNATVTGKRIF